ncbi:DUF2525 domain-containing protein [Pantoea sp. 1.19]|uniref:DUF2525 domain-containing protein n=1 Tax=Pantoea sp. 1.19 TaxID=1925589 RepID=UPI0011151B07|nr:DUF2525 domain-containing protein [Pantoea sp. 1.19]
MTPRTVPESDTGPAAPQVERQRPDGEECASTRRRADGSSCDSCREFCLEFEWDVADASAAELRR